MPPGRAPLAQAGRARRTLGRRRGASLPETPCRGVRCRARVPGGSPVVGIVRGRAAPSKGRGGEGVFVTGWRGGERLPRPVAEIHSHDRHAQDHAHERARHPPRQARAQPEERASHQERRDDRAARQRHRPSRAPPVARRPPRSGRRRRGHRRLRGARRRSALPRAPASHEAETPAEDRPRPLHRPAGRLGRGGQPRRERPPREPAPARPVPGVQGPDRVRGRRGGGRRPLLRHPGGRAAAPQARLGQPEAPRPLRGGRDDPPTADGVLGVAGPRAPGAGLGDAPAGSLRRTRHQIRQLLTRALFVGIPAKSRASSRASARPRPNCPSSPSRSRRPPGTAPRWSVARCRSTR